jgi:hypothetical protein
MEVGQHTHVYIVLGEQRLEGGALVEGHILVAIGLAGSAGRDHVVHAGVRQAREISGVCIELRRRALYPSVVAVELHVSKSQRLHALLLSIGLPCEIQATAFPQGIFSSKCPQRHFRRSFRLSARVDGWTLTGRWPLAMTHGVMDSCQVSGKEVVLG